MNEQKIAESIRFICKKQGKECVFNNCGNCVACPSIGVDLVKLNAAILALIEQEQKQSRMAGYDDGVGIGKALQSVEDEKKIKPMVEALSLARFHIAYLKGGMNPEDRLPSTDKVLAKIDAVLPKGAGE